MNADAHWVPYGRPAGEALRAAVAEAKGDEPLTPVTVVVPSNHVGVAARRLLASGALGPLTPGGLGIAGVAFLTPYRLADLLGTARLAGRGRRPVSTPLIAAALRSALRERPGVFAPVAEHPATESALVAAYRELRDLSEPALRALAARSPRAGDVVRLHRRARALLRSSWYDEQDLVRAAIDSLEQDPSVAATLGRVVVYLPQRLSRHSGRLLASVADRVPTVVLAGTTGDPAADHDVAVSVSRLGAALGGPDAAVDPMAAVGGERTRIVSVSDSDEEVRVAARAVVDAARAGVPLDRIAVLHASPQPYARLVHEHLGSLGIRVNGASAVPLTARGAGRAILGFLGLADNGFRRQDVFAWLGGAPLHHQGRPVPVAAWERISREAGVVAGRAQWDRRLARFAEERTARAAAPDPDAAPWRAERDRDEARWAAELRSFVLGLIGLLDDAARAALPWSQRARWARALLDELLGSDRARAGWPMVEDKAAERVAAAIERLASLDALEPEVPLHVFGRTLELELEADLGRVGRMGDGVLVGPASLGVGLDLHLVIVLGLAEGVFPAPTRDDSLLPDHERAATAGELTPRSARVEQQHRELLAALAGSAHHLLGVPRGDLRRSCERVPSRWVLQMAGALAGRALSSGDLADLADLSQGWLSWEASFDDGLRRMDSPAGPQEHRLRTLMAGAPLDDPVFAVGRAMIGARRSPSFTRFDGNLSSVDVPSPADRPTSATRLEGWATCPFAYLLHRVLRVEEVEQPEEQLEMTAPDRGTLVHEVLERFIGEVLRRPAGWRPTGQAWDPADRALLADLGRQVCDEFEAHGLTGRPLFWRRDRARILADLQRFLHLDDDVRAARACEPVAAELSFGLPGSALGPVELPIAGGGAVEFRGKADRVDRGSDGTLLVVDYKTGRPDSVRTLTEREPDAQGQKLQLPVYAEAARLREGAPTAPVRAEYWFVSAKGRFSRVGIAVDDEVLARVGETLARIVGGIEAGVFPAYPRGGSSTPWVTCPYCDPDALGTADLTSRWERKRGDPALAGFLALAEPGPGVAAASGGGSAPEVAAASRGGTGGA